MADPLSLAASLIAVLGASGKTLQGLEQIWQLRNRDEEFIGLVNQITAFRAQLRILKLALSSIPSDTAQFQQCLPEILMLCTQADDVFSQLNKSVKEVQDKSKGKDDKPKTSIRAWIKHKTTLQRHVAQIAALVASFSSAVNVLQNLRLDQKLTGLHPELSIQSVSIIQPPTDSSDAVSLSTSPPIEGRLETAIGQVVEATTSGDTSSRISSRRSSVDSFHTASSLYSTSHLRLNAILSTHACGRACSCQCHTKSRLKSPEWMKGIFGSMNVYGNPRAVLNRRPCDIDCCSRSGSASMEISYFAPFWWFISSCSVQVKAQTLRGLSSSFSISTPRVIPNTSAVWAVIDAGNLAELRTMITRGETSPYDVSIHGISLLRLAAVNLRFEIYALLLGLGADPYYRDQSGTAAIQGGIDHLAYSRSPKLNEYRYLFVNEEALDEQNFTGLHHIILGFNTTDLNTYIPNNQNEINMPDANGRTPLLWATWRGDVESVRSLIDAGADIDTVDHQGDSALAKACHAGSLPCVELLLEANARVDSRDMFGTQAIHLASMNPKNGTRIVRELVAKGADPCARSASEMPLHSAAVHGSRETVEYLLSFDPSTINAPNVYGDTPSMLASRFGNRPVLELLLARALPLQPSLSTLLPAEVSREPHYYFERSRELSKSIARCGKDQIFFFIYVAIFIGALARFL